MTEILQEEFNLVPPEIRRQFGQVLMSIYQQWMVAPEDEQWNRAGRHYGSGMEAVGVSGAYNVAVQFWHDQTQVGAGWQNRLHVGDPNNMAVIRMLRSENGGSEHFDLFWDNHVERTRSDQPDYMPTPVPRRAVTTILSSSSSSSCSDSEKGRQRRAQERQRRRVQQNQWIGSDSTGSALTPLDLVSSTTQDSEDSEDESSDF